MKTQSCRSIIAQIVPAREIGLRPLVELLYRVGKFRRGMRPVRGAYEMGYRDWGSRSRLRRGVGCATYARAIVPRMKNMRKLAIGSPGDVLAGLLGIDRTPASDIRVDEALRWVAAQPDQTITIFEDADDHDYKAAETAEKMGLITIRPGHYADCIETYSLTNAGRVRIGLDPQPRVIDRARRWMSAQMDQLLK